MKKTNRRDNVNDDLRAEYDFDYSKAVQGKYHHRLIAEGSNVVLLDPDMAKVFRDSTSVNQALRTLLELTQATQRLTQKRGRQKNLKSIF